MKKLIILIPLVLIASAANGEVFKCKTSEGTVYSEIPCASNAKSINTTNGTPSEDDVRAAETRMRNDINQAYGENNEIQSVNSSQNGRLRMGVETIHVTSTRKIVHHSTNPYMQSQSH